MKLKINVKEEHIVNGKCKIASKCAIALAVNDVIANVEVTGDMMRLGPYLEKICDLPTLAIGNIWMFDQFDRDKIVGKDRLKWLSPFSFEVDIDEAILFPDKLLEEIKQIIEGSKNIELVEVKK